MNDRDYRDILIDLIKTVIVNHNERIIIDDSTKLIDLGADELDIVEIAMGIEDETGIDIYYVNETEWINLEMSEITVGEILKRLENGKK